MFCRTLLFLTKNQQCGSSRNRDVQDENLAAVPHTVVVHDLGVLEAGGEIEPDPAASCRANNVVGKQRVVVLQEGTADKRED